MIHLHVHTHDKAKTRDDWAKWNEEHRTAHGNAGTHARAALHHSMRIQQHGNESPLGKRHAAASAAHTAAAGALSQASMHRSSKGFTPEAHEEHMQRAERHAANAKHHESMIEKHHEMREAKKKPAMPPKPMPKMAAKGKHTHVNIGHLFNKAKTQAARVEREIPETSDGIAVEGLGLNSKARKNTGKPMHEVNSMFRKKKRKMKDAPCGCGGSH